MALVKTIKVVNGVCKEITTDSISFILPAGVIRPYSALAVPTGWLACDGASYPTASYPDLFAIIGYTYGGSGANFNVPDLTTRIPVGYKSGDADFGALNQKAGEAKHILTMAEMFSHSHSLGGINQNHQHYYECPNDAQYNYVGSPYRGAPYYNAYSSWTTGVNGGETHTHSIYNAGLDQSHNNLMPYIVLNYIIKY